MSYEPSKSPIMKLWNRFGNHNLGRFLVSKIVCLKAPYFSTIKPVFIQIKPGLVRVKFKNRRQIQNHIKSVHAIAMCNAAELVGGVCLDVSLDARFRWIPIGMEVKYLKMAKSDLTAESNIEDFKWDSPQDVKMPVSIYNTAGEKVFSAEITMKISERIT